MSIVAESVGVRRGARTVLADVSLRVREGEGLCIIGPNGAGKTTLLLVLAGLIDAFAGRVSLDDRPIHREPRRRVARRLTYVPQIYDGYLGFRVRDVLESARFAHLHPLQQDAASDEARIEHVLDECGLRGLDERPLYSLSAGERQRVWLAGALVQEAAFLLLDEPTTALDPQSVAIFLAILRRQLQRGRGVLLVCHDLNVAAAIGERIVALRNGRIEFDGPANTFFTAPRLADLYAARFELIPAADGRRVHVAQRFEPTDEPS